ncbi:MAG: citrate CoA-transferase [Alphaproteobacteria bacterium]|nr:citrate CoA-transferase [Alphaproteobacteria bacterium]
MTQSRTFDQRQDDLSRLSSPLGGRIRPYHCDSVLPPMLPQRASSGSPPIRLADIEAAFDLFEIGNGSTLSFHHHFRNADRLMNAVLRTAAQRGLKGLTIAPSSMFPVHDELAEHIRNGVIANIITDYMKGAVADSVTDGDLQGLALLQSHGGRARAIASGQLQIDAAFIGASEADESGAATGRLGEHACGPLGYAMVDAAFAKHTVVAAHNISGKRLTAAEIPGTQVDALLQFENPGSPDGISFGATLPLETPAARKIGAMVVEIVTAAGLMKDGLSFQSGAGGYSLGAVPFLGRAMEERGLKGHFISGGITSAHIEIVKRGAAREIRDVQCFDEIAARSSGMDPWHKAISATQYASPLHPNPTVNQLDVMLLGAIEVDRAFNVNVVNGGNGQIFGGPGGHPDAAFGASLSIVTTGLVGGGYAKLVDHVRCVSTPGDSVDVVVTDCGIAVHPNRKHLHLTLKGAGLPVVPFESLIEQAGLRATKHQTPITGSPCALVEARDGRILDVVYTR